MQKTILKIILGLAIVAAAGAAGFYFGQNKTGDQAANTKDTATQGPTNTTAADDAASSNNELTPIDFEPEPINDAVAETEKTEAKAEESNTEGNEATKMDNNDIKSPTDITQSGTVATERFVIAIGQNAVDNVAASLKDAGFIDDAAAFKAAIKPGILALVAGGYKLSKSMTEAQVAAALQDRPYMKWIIVPEGLRKEEVAQMLAQDLGWTEAVKTKWITTDTATVANYGEGVYFPDTYLIPVDEEPAKTAARMQARFNEAFAAYLPQFNQQNIKWTTGLTFASIVQREAKNDSDMPLVAGILWNRLERGMALDADATLQYARGDTGSGWWAPATAADKAIDSPYNTYANKGLPPHPICSPGTEAIEATLAPATTDCLYYLHGNDGIMHCAAAYEQHLQNIDIYLKTE